MAPQTSAKHNLTLTTRGREDAGTACRTCARRAQSKLLSAFSAGERGAFVALLEKFIAHFNDLDAGAHRAAIAKSEARQDVAAQEKSP